MRLVWSWELVYRKLEIWRLVSPFVFWGGFSFPFLINMYVLVSYSKNYEASPYDTGGGGGPADYAWMLVIGAGLLLIMSTLLGVLAPSQGLTYDVLYVWSRRNPTMPVSLYGFKLPAVYLPWALLAFNMVIGNDLTAPLMGVVAGHVYYFAVDAAPLKYGNHFVKKPTFIIDLFESAATAPRGGMTTGYSAAPPPRRPENAPGGAGGPNAGGLFQRRGNHNWGAGRQLGAD